jgi:DNA-binding CsgD family transcriptional regulator
LAPTGSCLVGETDASAERATSLIRARPAAQLWGPGAPSQSKLPRRRRTARCQTARPKARHYDQIVLPGARQSRGKRWQLELAARALPREASAVPRRPCETARSASGTTPSTPKRRTRPAGWVVSAGAARKSPKAPTTSKAWLPSHPCAGCLRSPCLGLDHSDFRLLSLMAEGFADKEIAGLLGRSVWTVNRNVHDLMRRMDVSSRTEACIVALKRALIH